MGHDFYEGERDGPRGFPRFTDPRLRGPEGYGDYLRMATERSLERCGLDHFDLLLLHNPDRTGYTSDVVWEAMAELRADGLAGAIGVAPGPANGFTLDVIACLERFGELIDWAMLILNPLEPWPGELALPAAADQQLIRDHLDQHPGLRAQRDLLITIPGIGETTAAVLIAELFDKRDTSARQAAAFAGLVPRLVESGTLRGRARLSKIGPGRLRKALYFPAVAALRWNPTIRAVRVRLAAAGKPPMVIIGAAMRKLIHIAYGVQIWASVRTDVRPPLTNNTVSPVNPFPP